jgi:four helix bundle protein
LAYAIRVAIYVRKIAKNLAFDVLARQLLRSATSIGANMSEADAASSKNDFIHKVIISKKEAQETVYWLKILHGADFINNIDNQKELKYLLNECQEIIKILGAIIRSSQNKHKAHV